MVSCRCSFLLRSAPSFRGAFMDTICKCSWRFMGRGMGATISISTWSPTIHIPSFSAMPISIHLPPIMSNTLHHQPCCPRPEGTRFMASLPVVRWFRRMRRSALKRPPAEKELDLDIRIAFAENVYKDEELLNIAELLHLNVPMAMKVAFDGIKDSTAKTRDTAIEDVGSFEKVELSVLLCDNDFIRELNKEWRDMDCTTDVISMSQHIPGCQLPVLMLGDIAISVDAAAKQAVERGHSLLDEIRILMVHGMLHLLGYNNERSKEAQKEMEKEKDIILKCLGWKGIGSMHITNESLEDCRLPHKSEKENFDGWADQDIKTEKEKIMRSYKPKFKYLFCDMDGTLLNSKSLVSPRTAEALREANSRGVKIIIATGKARPAAMSALQLVDLAGEDGIISKSSPGVFLQGLLVYGKQGLELHRRNLDPDICKEAFLFSLEQQFPLVGFSEDRMVTLFNHPLIDALHSVYFEPKVGDFGLARWQPDGDLAVETRVIGTFGYLAPEYAQSGQITEKADVYSFGVVLVELVTGRKAVDINRPKGQQCLTEWARPLLEEHAIYALVDPRLGNNYSQNEVYCMLHAASLCIRKDSHLRPRMSQVLRILEGNSMIDASCAATPAYGSLTFVSRTSTSSEYCINQIGAFNQPVLDLNSSLDPDSIVDTRGKMSLFGEPHVNNTGKLSYEALKAAYRKKGSCARSLLKTRK